MIASFQGIHHSYGDKEVLKDISLNLYSGEILCVLGPSGCGKTTLLNILSGAVEPSGGEVLNRSERLSYVFQEDRLLPWRTVFENIHIVDPLSRASRVDALIEAVELGGFENYMPDALSGGMRQRVSIARGFFYPAELMLLDEPLKSLDYCLRLKMISHIYQLARKTDKALVFVTHGIDEALLIADRIVVLSKSPSVVIDEFELKTLQKERSLGTDEMIEAKRRIVEQLEGRGGIGENPQFRPEAGSLLFRHTVQPRT